MVVNKGRITRPSLRSFNGTPIIAASLYEGKAIGGPRDGVKLSASLQWDGTIRKQTKEGVTTNTTYPGRYKWSNVDTDEFNVSYTWVWQPDETEQKVRHPQPITKRGYHR